MPLFGAVRLIVIRRTFATGQDLHRDQAVLDKLKADQNFAFDTLKVDAQEARSRSRNWIRRSDRCSSVGFLAFRLAFPGRLQTLRHCNEAHPYPVFLDPGNAAFPDRRIPSHHQAEVSRNKGRVRNLDIGTFERDIPDHAAHDGTARRYVGGLVDFGPREFSSLFHGFCLAWRA
jgi:hypothetical protein